MTTNSTNKGHWTRNALLSISIDLCDSTAIKQEIVARSGNDQQYRSRLYASYVLHFFNTEKQFYYQVRHQDDLDIRRLLLVKLIGDEFWFVYEVNTDEKDDLKRTIAAFFRAIGSMLKRAPSFEFSDEIMLAKNHTDKTTIKQFDAPLKSYIDIIGEPAEVNMARFEYLKGHLPRLLGHTDKQYRIDEDFIELCKKMNLANISIADGKMTKQIRPDFIGLEIDRFFRLTKFCRPRILTVGDSLIQLLEYTIGKNIGNMGNLDVKEFSNKIPNLNNNDFFYDKNNICSEPVSAAEMKGLSKSYTVHHLF